MEFKPEDHELPLTLPLIFDDQCCSIDGKQDEIIESIFDHRPQASNTSFTNTCFNGLNALSGVGLVSVPFALSSGGWLSMTLVFAVAIVSFYSGLLIKRCMDFDSSIATYPDIGNRAFGKGGRTVVSVFMYVELYMVATGFLILEGDNLHDLFPGVRFEIAGFSLDGEACFVLIVALVILPSVWIDNMSLLSYVSATGVIASFVILGSIIWTGASDQNIGFNQKGSLLNWSGIPSAISLYAFCYCAHPVFPTLYTSMKNKRHFSNVLLVCFVICTITYASMAIFGFLMFGSEVQSQITLNLPTSRLSSRVAIYTALISPIAKYALMIRPIVDALKSCLPNHLKNKRFLSMVIGTTILISSVVVALIIPFFASLMSLVGAFCSVTASIILPCLCYLKISCTFRKFGCEMVILVAIVVMGVGVAILGTYISLVEIIGDLKL